MGLLSAIYVSRSIDHSMARHAARREPPQPVTVRGISVAAGWLVGVGFLVSTDLVLKYLFGFDQVGWLIVALVLFGSLATGTLTTDFLWRRELRIAQGRPCKVGQQPESSRRGPNTGDTSSQSFRGGQRG